MWNSRTFASIALAAVSLVAASGCSRGSGSSNGACQRIVGMWQGDGITANGGQDPEAIRVVNDVMREEQWRITRVTPTGLQRERMGAAGGRASAEAMYVTAESQTACAVEIRDRDQHTRTARFEVHADGHVDVTASDSWYTLRLRRR